MIKPVNKRHINRLIAMQFLYMNAINPVEDLSDGLRCFTENLEQSRDYYSFAEELIMGVYEHLEEIDETIKRFAQNWSFSRIAKIDLAILRMAIFELLYRRDIPPVVTINEAIDMGKEYSDPDSKRFINGILDRLKQELNRPDRTPAE